MLKVIIIDDEQPARETIKDIIQQFGKDVSVIAEAGTVKEGIEVINKYQPDAVLLDIKLTDGTGFDVLQEVNTDQFKTIFITAYEEHAIKAFKYCALDYILKPVDSTEVIEALDRAKVKSNEDEFKEMMELFSRSLKGENKKIVLKTAENIHLINIQSIVRCEADRNYTRFYLKDAKTLLISNTLKEYNGMLEGYGFFRAHQSHLVNLNCIERYEKQDGGSIIMDNGDRVPVSHRRRETLLRVLDAL